MKRITSFLGLVFLAGCADVLGLDEYSESGTTQSTSGGTTGVGGDHGSSSSTTSTTTSVTTTTTTTVSSGTGGAAPSYLAKAVTGGAQHTCALLEDGRVACWGNNDNGQLGDGSFKSSPVPVLVEGITNASSIDAGALHTCALLSTGDVRCWGNNDHRELGVISADSNIPVAPVGLPANLGGVTAGGTHSCAWLSTGRAYCWGGNDSGQLGRNVSGGAANVAAVDLLMSVRSVSAGAQHTCAAADTITVYCWGDNTYMQTGGSNNKQLQPRQVGFVPSAGPPQFGAPVESAADAICNLKGNAWCWGRQVANKLTSNQGAAIDTQLTNVVQLAGGGQHFCVRYQNGKLDCWGENDAGQLGNGMTGASTTTVVSPMGIADAIDVGVGDKHSCAVVTTSGTPAVFCWGANASGQLGDGTSNPSPLPVPVMSLP